MKKLFLSIALLSTNFCYAESLVIRNLNFGYENPQGEGLIGVFERNDVSDENLNLRVEKNFADFRFILSGRETSELTLSGAPEFIADADKMTITGANLSFKETALLNLSSGSFDSPDNRMQISGLSIDCARDHNYAETSEQLIAGCLKKMVMKTSKFSTKSESLELMATGSSIGVNSLDVKINSGKFELTADLKAQISGKVKTKGTATYNNDKITIKVTEMKFGILSVMGKVFEELKKQESEKLKVNEPYITILLK